MYFFLYFLQNNTSYNCKRHPYKIWSIIYLLESWGAFWDNCVAAGEHFSLTILYILYSTSGKVKAAITIMFCILFLRGVCDVFRKNKKVLFRPNSSTSRQKQQRPVIGRRDILMLCDWAAVYSPLLLAVL